MPLTDHTDYPALKDLISTYRPNEDMKQTALANPPRICKICGKELPEWVGVNIGQHSCLRLGACQPYPVNGRGRSQAVDNQKLIFAYVPRES